MAGRTDGAGGTGEPKFDDIFGASIGKGSEAKASRTNPLRKVAEQVARVGGGILRPPHPPEARAYECREPSSSPPAPKATFRTVGARTISGDSSTPPRDSPPLPEVMERLDEIDRLEAEVKKLEVAHKKKPTVKRAMELSDTRDALRERTEAARRRPVQMHEIRGGLGSSHTVTYLEGFRHK